MPHSSLVLWWSLSYSLVLSVQNIKDVPPAMSLSRRSCCHCTDVTPGMVSILTVVAKDI